MEYPLIKLKNFRKKGAQRRKTQKRTLWSRLLLRKLEKRALASQSRTRPLRQVVE